MADFHEALFFSFFRFLSSCFYPRPYPSPIPPRASPESPPGSPRLVQNVSHKFRIEARLGSARLLDCSIALLLYCSMAGSRDIPGPQSIPLTPLIPSRPSVSESHRNKSKLPAMWPSRKFAYTVYDYVLISDLNKRTYFWKRDNMTLDREANKRTYILTVRDWRNVNGRTNLLKRISVFWTRTSSKRIHTAMTLGAVVPTFSRFLEFPINIHPNRFVKRPDWQTFFRKKIFRKRKTIEKRK